ncbi:MAG: hypothetical protein NW217_04765 [Hyphomicrobiaceae bacterium]|nr:hypothetical protein [Hyphomicrobiaceae bacterium]
MTAMAILAVALLGASPVAVAATGAPSAASPSKGARTAVQVAQAVDPLVVSGPLRIAPGEKAAFPVTVAPGAAPSGRYVLIYQAPAWLTFSSGERIGRGVWLLEKAKLAEIEVVLASDATGQHAITVGAVDTAGAVEWQTPLTIEVAPAGTTVAVATEPPAVAPVAPVAPAAPTEPVAPPAAAAAPQPEPVEPAPGPPSGPPAVTWESLVNNRVPAPIPAVPATPRAVAKAPTGNLTDDQKLATAKHLVRECTTCHNLFGQDVGIPVMVGLTVYRFLDIMHAYRTKKREHQLMQVIAQSLSEEETEALAMYLSRIKPAAGGNTAGGAAGQANADQAGAAAGPGGADAAPVLPAVKKLATDAKTIERVARWVQRGEEMLDAGDIAQARLLLQRATEYGHARAAMLMATSYDPNALPWKAGTGLVAEPLLAHRWYVVAKELGAGDEVDRRLADLPIPR